MKLTHLCKLILLMVICLLGIVQMVYAWPGVDDNGVAICTDAHDQYNPQLVSDGQGGAIITWQDYRNGDPDIYAQAVDSTGAVKWTADGMAICTVSNSQDAPQLVSDGQGGAIISWNDTRNDTGGFTNCDIYAQAIDSTGAVKWTTDGVAICTAANNQYNSVLVTDGQGGAIITWQDFQNGNADVYAQAVDSAGAAKWTANGVAICLNANGQISPQLVSDGQGGAIITWYDTRNGNNDIYAQAVDSTGAAKWAPDGIALCGTAGAQLNPHLVTDGQGGAIIAWQDQRNGNSDIYAQAVDSTGAVKWTADGVAICTDANDQYFLQLVSDGQGGAIIPWMDTRNGNADIYAQAIVSTGTVKWTTNGMAICTDVNDQFTPQLISDGQGGAIITWQDIRNGNTDLYAQAVDSTGVVKWTVGGMAICTYWNSQDYPQLVSDGQGGAIITWQDGRNGNTAIYAQSMNMNGLVPVELSGFMTE